MKSDESIQIKAGLISAVFSLFIFPSVLFGVVFLTFFALHGLSGSLVIIGGLMINLSHNPELACDTLISMWSAATFVGFLFYGACFSVKAVNVKVSSQVDLIGPPFAPDLSYQTNVSVRSCKYDSFPSPSPK